MAPLQPTSRRIQVAVATSWIILVLLQGSFFHKASISTRVLSFIDNDAPDDYSSKVNRPQEKKQSIRSSCPFAESPLYKSIYVYPSPMDAEWKGSILSEHGKHGNITWPWLEMDRRLKAEGKAHYDANHNGFNQYTTELLIRDIMTHPDSCLRTIDPEQASLFYVPYLPSMEYHNGSLFGDYKTSPFGEALLEATTSARYNLWESTFGLTSKYWERKNGSDHILVMSEPLHGLNHPRSKRGNYHFIHSQKQLSPPIIVSIELSTTFVEMYPNCARKNILMPYPNTDGKWFNGEYDNQARDRMQYLSQSTMIAEHRARPLTQFYSAGNHGTCKTLRQSLGRNYKCTESAKLASGTKYQHGYRKATFCPCPGGDSPSAKRHFDALHAGCIPIILSHDFVWPFTNEILRLSNKIANDFSIRLDAKDYESSRKYDNQCQVIEASSNHSTDLQSYLETIPNKEIERLRHGTKTMSEQYSYYQRRADLPENPLREGVLPNGGAAHMLVQLLSERANGRLWDRCAEELKEKSHSSDKVLSFKC